MRSLRHWHRDRGFMIILADLSRSRIYSCGMAKHTLNTDMDEIQWELYKEKSATDEG